MDEQVIPAYPGDPQHPRHKEYLLELGRATYAAASLASIAFDILRVHDGIDSAALYNDPLGRLKMRLEKAELPLNGMKEFLELLEESRVARSDLIHALPVLDGLYRRNASNPYYEREFFSVESLREVRVLFEKTLRKGNEVLYADNGKAAEQWCSQSST